MTSDQSRRSFLSTLPVQPGILFGNWHTYLEIDIYDDTVFKDFRRYDIFSTYTIEKKKQKTTKGISMYVMLVLLCRTQNHRNIGSTQNIIIDFTSVMYLRFRSNGKYIFKIDKFNRIKYDNNIEYAFVNGFYIDYIYF